MQRGKVRDRVRMERNEPQMVKPLRSYNPHEQVALEVSQRPYPLIIPHSQLIVHLKGKEYVTWPPKIKNM